MILLRLLTWPYVRKHKLRTILTIAGITLGVVVFVGMRTANDSVLYGFQQTVDKIAGKSQLQVTASEAGFPEEILEKVQATPGVDIAVPVIEAVVSTARDGQGNLLILAVDMTGDRNLRQYDFEEGEEAIIDDPLVFLAQPDSLIVTRDFASENKLATGGRIALETMDGPKQFTVRGIMKSGGLASAFGGNLAIMDIYAAQKILGRGRMFDRIDLTVKPDSNVDTIRETLSKTLGEGLQVDPPSSRGKQFESISRLFAVGASLNSLFALLIGLFIIYNTFSIAVAQRRPEIGILRSLGASRGQIRFLFILESAVLGLAGSVAGIIFGLLLARGMAVYLSSMFTEVYGVAQRTQDVAADPSLMAFAIAVGIFTSVLAAWIPARDAAKVDPVKALHKGGHESLSDHENRIRMIAGAAFIGLALICLLSGGSSGPRLYIGYVSMVMAAVLFTPSAVRWLVRGMRPGMRAVLPVEGALAADSLLQSPRRTSATVAAVMLSLALVVGLGGIAQASYSSIHDWMDAALNPDLFVSSSATITNRSFRFPASMGDELSAMSEVEAVQTVRTTRIIYHGSPVMLVATDLRSLAERIRPNIVAGDRATMYREASEGRGVIVADNLAILHKLRLGDPLELATPSGPLTLPVKGIIADYSDQQGSFFMDRRLFVRYWKDETANVFRVYLKKGLAPEEGRRRILERFSGNRRLFIMTNDQVREYIIKITDQWFGLTYLQIFVAVLVAVLGIVNSLTVSITDRRRELGVLQAVGALRRQVRQAIWMEALGIGLVSIVLGLALGGIILYYYLGIVREDLAGLRLNYEYPFKIALLLIPMMLAAALLSALGPAESAVRASLVEALEYE